MLVEKMEKRSWLWKKKTSEKSLTSPDPDTAEKIRRLNERLLAADDLAKQHATVAEEAVSGWEKTKAEYMAMKYQLDTVLEQKQAAEVRVFHLDGALKECMQQLRQGREEQEQAVHEAIVKRSREWDKLRLDLEERLAHVEGQLMESENQRTLLYKTTQEQAEAVADLGRIHAEEEVEIKKLRVQAQTLEKENTSLKYEIVVLNKELGIRNQEREMNRKSLDMASQQHIDSSKRIAKLETECQRLRALVRKKLPGPGALLQMKLEAERGDAYHRRRGSGRGPGSPVHAGVIQRSPKTGSMGHGLHITDSFKEHSRGAMSDDGYDDNQSVADSWTSSSITEPFCSQREGASPQRSKSVPSSEGFDKLNSTDNFLEIERLVSLPSEKQGVKPIVKAGTLTNISDELLAKDAEHQAAIQLSPEINRATQVLNQLGDAACGRKSSHLREGSQVDHSAAELGNLILKVIRIVEDLASKVIGDFGEHQPGDDVNGHNIIQHKPKLQLSELEASFKKFNAAGNAYLYGNAELVLFMTALYSVLNQLNTLPRPYKPLISRPKWRPEGKQIAEQDVISDVGSPFSSSSTSDRSDSSKKPQLEKGASESHSREESIGIATMEHAITVLQQEKLELEKKLEEERGKLDLVKGQLCDSEQLVVSLRARLASAELSGIVAEKSLSSITAMKAQLEVRLQDSQLELGRLREKVKDLELCHEQEKKRNQESQIKADLQRTIVSSPHNDIERSNKEQEIADASQKLAECQRTILVLGQQLKDIVSTQDENQTVTYLNQVLDNAGLSNHTQPTSSPILPSNHTIYKLTDPPKSAESGSLKETFDSWEEETKDSSKLNKNADKQIVTCFTRPAPKKKSSLHTFPASAMSKSLNLEPYASPRKQSNSFSKLFSRHKSSA